MSRVDAGKRTVGKIYFRLGADENDLMTFSSLSRYVGGIETLLISGYYLNPEGDPEEQRRRRQEYFRPDSDMWIERLRYNSPLELVMAFPVYLASCVAAARGVVYLMSKVEDYRVKHAESNYRIDLMEHLRTQLEWPADGPRLPNVAVLSETISLLTQLDEVRLEGLEPEAERSDT